MNISSSPSSSFVLGGDRSRSPGGMSWLLESGSQSSLLSNPSGNNYQSMNSNASSAERRQMQRTTSAEMRRPKSLSIPELAQLDESQHRTRNEPGDVLSQAISVVVGGIFGLYGLEIWNFNEKSGSLTSIPIKPPNTVDIRRQRSGIFIKRVTQEADQESPNFNSAARDAFERLTDTTRLDYLSQKTTDPGVGVAGALWSDATTSKPLAVVQHGVQSISSSVHRRVSLLAGLPTHNHGHENANSVLWREVDSLAEDPDQPYDERLQSFAKAGFKLAAGIPFDIRGYRGIVVFYANPHADARKLRDDANSQLIQFAAQFIGSAAAIHNPIQNAILAKNRRPISNWKRLRVKIMAVIKFQRPCIRRRSRSGSFGSPSMRRVDSFKLGMRRVASFAMNREDSLKILSDATSRLKKDIEKTVIDVQYASKAKGMKWWQKVQGGHAMTPPAFNIQQCMWTFVGVGSTHTMLSWLDSFIVSKSAGKYQLVLGPLGALTTLQYNLTAAPASQPRNAIFSQIIALSTCYFLHQIQDMDRCHRCALAPAIVTTTTAWLGIIHPPAGATSVVFSYDGYKLEDMLIFLGGVSIAIFLAVVINNLSDKRQYPSTKWMH